jgi:uncharacterized membrane protein YhaH (DUF805 family)
MAFSDPWHGRTGRLPYLAALVISSAVIMVLPFVAGKIAMAVADGMDPALAILRSLVRMYLLAPGVLIAGLPLVFFARRRMRELGLSGVWLLLFPIGPLMSLVGFAIASGSLMVWPLPITSPVMAPPFWVEMAFGASLAVLPSGNYLEHSDKPALRLAHLATACEGRLDRQAFRLHLVVALGLYIALEVFGAFGMISRFGGSGGNPLSFLAGMVAAVSTVLSTFVTMFVTASTVRRLHDLDQSGGWIILFPFGLISAIAGLSFILVFLATLGVAVAMLSNPYTMFSIAHGFGCVILLVRLLSKHGSDAGNSYGPPVNPPNDGYSPAFGR